MREAGGRRSRLRELTETYRELAERVAEYPRASLLADRASALAALGVPLEDGLRQEEERGIPTLSEPELAEGLQRYASGDRPEPPVPAD